MDIKEIQNLIKFVAKSGASEVSLEMDDVKITIKTGDGKSAERTLLSFNKCLQLLLSINYSSTPVPAPTPVAETPATKNQPQKTTIILSNLLL